MSLLIWLPAGHLHVVVPQAETLEQRSALHPKQAPLLHSCEGHRCPPILTATPLSLVLHVPSTSKPEDVHLLNASPANPSLRPTR